MRDDKTSIGNLKQAVGNFIHERAWEKYHNPKDLAESICIEAAELLQLFQWTTASQSANFEKDKAKVQQVKEELADVIIYCLSMANALDIDLTKLVLEKIEHNRHKYPADQYRGKAYLEL